MNLSEKVAYIRGLTEGLDIGTESKESKIINALIDLVDDMAFSVGEIEEQVDELSEQIDSVDEDLYTLENAFADCCDDYECECGCDHDHDDDSDIYEVICAKCGEPIYLDESIIETGSIDCPNCGELLEFEMGEDDDDEDDE